MEAGLVMLLRVAWIKGTLSIIVASIPWSKLDGFHYFLLGFGQTRQYYAIIIIWTILLVLMNIYTYLMERSKDIGPYNHICHWKFFCHFYALVVAWTTFLLVATCLYAYNMAPLVSQSLQFFSITSYLTRGLYSFRMHGSHSIKIEQRYRSWLSVFANGSSSTFLQLGCTFLVISPIR